MTDNTYIEFNAKTSWNKTAKPPVVRISTGERGQGRIAFSTEAVKIMGLKKGMRLAFRVYKFDPTIIYIYEQATGFPLQVGNEHKSGVDLVILCRPLAGHLLQAIGFKKDKSITFDVTGQQVQMATTNCKAWFVQKENIHQPIKWRKNA